MNIIIIMWRFDKNYSKINMEKGLFLRKIII
jgi:hypothetical protein